MAILKVSNVQDKIILSHPTMGQIAFFEPGGNDELYVSVTILEDLADQIEAYVNQGLMEYEVLNDPNVNDDLEAAAIDSAKYLGNSIIWGIDISAGTTPSDTTMYRCDIIKGEARVNGYHVWQNLEVDFEYLTVGVDLNGDPATPIFLEDDECVASIVMKQEGISTPSIYAVFGNSIPYSIGAEIPTDAQITSALGIGTWIRIENVRIRRTAGPTITEWFSKVREVPSSCL